MGNKTNAVKEVQSMGFMLIRFNGCFSFSGYGDLCPSTSTGRLFVVLFGITGIPLLMLSISELTKKILGALEQISSHPPKFFSHVPLVFRHSRNINSIKVRMLL